MNIKVTTKKQKIKNNLLQYEVPDNFVKNLKTYKAKLNVWDLLIFHRKAVHTSSFNYSKKYSFAIVLEFGICQKI